MATDTTGEAPERPTFVLTVDTDAPNVIDRGDGTFWIFDDPPDPDAPALAPLGEGWTDVGYIEDPPRESVYGFYPVEWGHDGPKVAAEPSAEVAPLPVADTMRVANLIAARIRAAMPPDAVRDRNQEALETDMLLTGSRYADQDGRRVPPADLVTRRDRVGRPIELSKQGIADMCGVPVEYLGPTEDRTYDNLLADGQRKARWAAAMAARYSAEATKALRDTGVLTDAQHVAYETKETPRG